MAFKSINNNKVTKRFWKANDVNDSITGHFLGFGKDKFNCQCVVLVTEENEETKQFTTTTLPSHKSLVIHCQNIFPGEYVRITYLGMKKPKKDGKKPYNDYRVETDDEEFKNYDLVLTELKEVLK